ncbi:hypothetical protein J6590_062249 [Homalodisca vitripennis]|nr:hypothetical protein J6590_062249 [Homalodisca vitripennis]
MFESSHTPTMVPQSRVIFRNFSRNSGQPQHRSRNHSGRLFYQKVQATFDSERDGEGRVVTDERRTFCNVTARAAGGGGTDVSFTAACVRPFVDTPSSKYYIDQSCPTAPSYLLMQFPAWIASQTRVGDILRHLRVTATACEIQQDRSFGNTGPDYSLLFTMKMMQKVF